MKALQIGDLKIKLPIIQGGMGIGISMSKLASAVANEGGIGVIAAVGIGMFEKDSAKNFLEANMRALKREIATAREKTNGIIGVNIMVALTNFSDLVKTAIAEKADIIFSGAGLPLNLPQYLTKGAKTKLVPIVSSGRAAGILCKKWKELYNYLPDAFVVEGPKAGGHLGFKRNQIDNPDFELQKLVPDVVTHVKPFEEQFNVSIPVIAAGGIYTGADIKEIMDLGASGVQMGTRFVTTNECDASEKFKQSYIDSTEGDMEIIQSPVGMPGRAIRNEFIEKVNRGEKRPIKCPYKCLKTCDIEKTPYCIFAALMSAMKGNFFNGYAFAGSNAFRSTEIISVKSTFESILSEFKEAVARK
ncbi:MAG: nitronate monooxygenase [Prolixibacteraceae bacterium]|jgi:nitronate monooxygenase|nr:nitronate monooxygenase [Prolixibacteraceae bacterium]MBT6763617.1 nitronate monooxygenase [Prolixibacteraceae bacterium]MBT6999853.1 nitronate monooxygenase [Prolixibacteraceae bacterium]MBT7397189.1 nitronate monooxygenase [Prolixibacteraceae bacterium]